MEFGEHCEGPLPNPGARASRFGKPNPDAGASQFGKRFRKLERSQDGAPMAGRKTMNASHELCGSRVRSPHLHSMHRIHPVGRGY